MTKIFSFYMFRRFLAPFLFGLLLFSLLIFLGDMFDKMNELLKSSASLGVILEFLWLEVPYWTGRVIPMATLLATLVTLTTFIQSGEWLGAQSCGFQTRSFWSPILICSALVSISSFVFQETLFPLCFRKAELLWQDKIHPEWEWNTYSNIALIGAPDEFLQATVFLARQGLMQRPLLEKMGDGGVESQLDAQKALWSAPLKRWVFYNGVERRFHGENVVENVFLKKNSDLDIPPRKLIPRTKNPDEMSLRELRRYSKRMAALGVSPLELETAAYSKIAYPLSNLVICALGIPIALRLRRLPKAAIFFLALAISFLYLWVMEVSKALGSSGFVAPMAAAWIPNLVFGVLAIVGLGLYGEPASF